MGAVSRYFLVALLLCVVLVDTTNALQRHHLKAKAKKSKDVFDDEEMDDPVVESAIVPETESEKASSTTDTEAVSSKHAGQAVKISATSEPKDLSAVSSQPSIEASETEKAEDVSAAVPVVPEAAAAVVDTSNSLHALLSAHSVPVAPPQGIAVGEPHPSAPTNTPTGSGDSHVVIGPLMGRYLQKFSISLPEHTESLLVNFLAQGHNDLHIGLFDAALDENKMYEVVIGGWLNSRSTIRSARQGVELTSVSGAFNSPVKMNSFWIWVNKGEIKVGTGRWSPSATAVMKAVHPQPHTVKHVSFSTWNTEVIYDQIEVHDLQRHQVHRLLAQNPTPKPAKLMSTHEQAAVEKKQRVPVDNTMITVPPLKGKYLDKYALFMSEPSPYILLTFAAKAKDDIYVGFFDPSLSLSKMYDLVLGGWENSKAALRLVSHGQSVVESPYSLKSNQWTTYWVTVSGGALRVGQGDYHENARAILEFEHPDMWTVTKVGFSSYNSPVTYDNIKLLELKTHKTHHLVSTDPSPVAAKSSVDGSESRTTDKSKSTVLSNIQAHTEDGGHIKIKMDVDVGSKKSKSKAQPKAVRAKTPVKGDEPTGTYPEEDDDY